MTAHQATAACRQTDTLLAADLPKVAVAAESSAPLLSIKGLSVRFGGIVALDNVSFDVKAGQICGMIGPNGAGKTTLFNCVSRLYQPCAGTIHFAGEPLLQLARHRLARLGIARTFQNLALFQTMSAWDNVLIGGHCRSRGGFVANALRLPSVGCEERLLHKRASGLLQMLHLASVADLPVSVLPSWSRKRLELARALASEPVGLAHVPEGRATSLDLTVEENLRLGAHTRRDKGIATDFDRLCGYFPRLLEQRRQQAGTLSGGEQQMLAISRALRLRPEILLLDEPSFGLAPLVVQEIFRILRTIRRSEGVSMLLVEQNAHIALELADHAYLIETGSIVMGGLAAIIARDVATRRAYLGY
jgi:ABC-type branched-subunit amino acid transport system ATPase component